MSAHHVDGSWGESRAADFLVEKGYRILERNYRYNHAEIDLIAAKGKMMIFVEVKTRSGTGFGMPETFVNYTKIRLVKKAANFYIFFKDWQYDVRFDVISILQHHANGKVNIEHIEDAFH